MKTLIIYTLVSIIYTIISLIDGYFVWKRKLKKDPLLQSSIKSMKDMGKNFLHGFLDKRKPTAKRNKIVLIYAAFISIPMLFILCPLVMPLNVVGILYEIFWFKKIAREKQEAEEAKKRSEEFWKTEGDMGAAD